MNRGSVIRRYSPLKLKRNEKGETLLHRACIEGNLNKVLTLIEKGHELNPRDNSGWLPIHEACNYGYYEIVELLLARGARVNDVGGAECGGITPLHDACSGGHTGVIQLLIDNRANVIALDKQNQFPIDALKEYYDRNKKSLSEEQSNDIVSVEKKLRVLMKAHPGYSEALSRHISAKKACNSRLRSKNSKPRLPALLPEDEMVEDWLIIDHRSPRKKRRRQLSATNKVDQFFVGGHDHNLVNDSPVLESREGSSDEETDEGRLTSSLYCNEIDANSSDRDSVVYDDVEHDVIESDETDNDSVTELMDNELWRDKTDITNIADVQIQSTNSVEYINTYQPPITSLLNTQSNTNASSLRLRITVGNQRFLVPISSSDRERCTVSWLCEELTTRYYQLYNIRPQLILCLKDGSKLTPTDRLSDVLYGNDEELVASDIQWNISNVADKYMEECAKLNQFGHSNVTHVMKELDTRSYFSCRDFSMTCKQFQPLIKSICFQNNLRDLDISGNSLENEGFVELVTTLPLFSSIRSLNVSRNGLTSKSLELFCEMLANHCEAAIVRLEELVLNYNSLFSDPSSSQQLLHKLISTLSNLNKLSLTSTRLSLTSSNTSSSAPYLTGSPVQNCIEHLDLSSNHMNAPGVSWLLEEAFRFNRLKRLHLSRSFSITSEDESSKLIVKLQSMIHNGTVPLEELHVNNCVIGQTAVQYLCRLISESSTLKYLSICGNETIGNEELRQVINSITGTADLDVRNGCSVTSLICKDCNIVSPPSAILLSALRDNLQLSRHPLKLLQLTVDQSTSDSTREYVNRLFDTWQDKWGHAAVCENDEISRVATLNVN